MSAFSIGTTCAVAALLFALATLPRVMPRRGEGDALPEQMKSPVADLPQVLGSMHSAPELPLAVDQAHREMQLHLSCLVGGCPRKSAAFTVLVAAGRITPDAGRQ